MHNSDRDNRNFDGVNQFLVNEFELSLQPTNHT